MIANTNSNGNAHHSDQSTKAKYAGNMGIIHKFLVSEIKPQSLTLLHIQNSGLAGTVRFLSACCKTLFQFVTKITYTFHSCYISSQCIITFYFFEDYLNMLLSPVALSYN
jgi:hypothetical protein